MNQPVTSVFSPQMADEDETQAYETARYEQQLRDFEKRLVGIYEFDDSLDRAELIRRYFEAKQHRHSPLHDDPILKPILQTARERYAQVRRHDFSFANRVADTEAIRAILALPDDVIAKMQ